MTLLSLALIAAEPSVADIERNYRRWERRLRSRVAELHVIPAEVSTGQPADVVVSFSIDKHGRPTQALVQSSSGNAAYDQAAHRLVRRLGRIGPVPSVRSAGHRVLLKLSFGTASDEALDRQIANALDLERRAYSRRNIQIVTTDAIRTKSASR